MNKIHRIIDFFIKKSSKKNKKRLIVFTSIAIFKKILIVLIFFLFSCRSNLQVIPINNINQVKKEKAEGFFYILPKTEIIVEVNVAKITNSKGPYADYTEKYLGQLTDVIHKNETFWELQDISILDYPIPDSSQIYFISSKGNFPLNLSETGFPIAYNTSEHFTYITYNFSSISIEDKSKENSFLPVDKSYKIVYDTVYKLQTYDTIIRKVPVLKPNLVKKTTEEQAKELADKISTLTDDRAALLVGEGDNDYLPEGPALRIMLDEIDKLLNSYLQMFKGKSDTVYYKYAFKFIPEDYTNNQKKVLFKFSRKSGVQPADNLFGEEVYIELTPNGNYQEIKNFTIDKFSEKSQNKKYRNGLFYRIPQPMNIKITMNNGVLAENSVIVNQTGAVYSLPAKIFKDKSLEIKFYPKYGSIKEIYFKKR